MSDATIHLAHGGSLSNAALFVAAALGFMRDEGLDVAQPRYEPYMESPAGLLATGEADIGTTAFTQPYIDAHDRDPLRIVAGSGIRGLQIVARSGIDLPRDVIGRTVATFRSDPMEVLLYEYLDGIGVSWQDVDVAYASGWDQMFDGFSSGSWTVIAAIEPYCDRLVEAGGQVLTDGTDLWGPSYPDTVLVARRSFIERRPDAVRAVIRSMLTAERAIASDPAAAVSMMREFFPGFSESELLRSLERQPPRVDLRGLETVIEGRWPTLQALGLAASSASSSPDVFQLEFLAEEVGPST